MVTCLVPSSNFYPRPPRGGRRGSGGRLCRFRGISIHVLREEDDRKLAGVAHNQHGISIHVLREEDDWEYNAVKEFILISIHVLREEDDGRYR